MLFLYMAWFVPGTINQDSKSLTQKALVNRFFQFRIMSIEHGVRYPENAIKRGLVGERKSRTTPAWLEYDGCQNGICDCDGPMMNTRITMRSPANFSTEDAEYAAFVLGSSAIPYKYERVGHNEPFHTAISVRTGLETSVVQVRTRGRLRVRTAMPENSFAIALSRRGTLPHLVENE